MLLRVVYLNRNDGSLPHLSFFSTLSVRWLITGFTSADEDAWAVPFGCIKKKTKENARGLKAASFLPELLVLHTSQHYRWQFGSIILDTVLKSILRRPDKISQISVASTIYK